MVVPSTMVQEQWTLELPQRMPKQLFEPGTLHGSQSQRQLVLL